eukprot:Gregarina_sp_Poly_1__7709@NODE_434_length_8452_cov_51_670244_g354_i0_p2_GENE_NODE_434_length_8452_cov_51_670244_g354_i0NODE_434_length_8452_cov_51_670244_g354_i0_p2_ORF_typecomplete_len468_score76_87EFhand_4/PF12763_7/2_9e12EFhand_4/PF12763_7/2_2e19EFhand_7/PF13499_6/40EFhand_7/PF13499_6/2_8e08EFhand_9/PF14658_6/2EFhand_9/PF14658_6/0_05EFhand_11/PF08976_11/0_0013EFhand_8/PF13833_6/41EFhand_8/PF13833_6/0_32EFhand_6/PF13405_6/1_8e03EFhand_6/PF13405_6/0_24EFhand_6/PF13405_6/5_6e02SPARC_Ca_bdg/PF105
MISAKGGFGVFEWGGCIFLQHPTRFLFWMATAGWIQPEGQEFLTGDFPFQPPPVSHYDGQPNFAAQSFDAPPVSEYAAMLADLTQEAPFYDRYFGAMDSMGTGYADASQVSALFRRSGLDDATLEAIWQFANPHGNSVLDKAGFAVGCRLIAYAQNGYPPDAELIAAPPPSLPYFEMGDMEGGDGLEFEAPNYSPEGGDGFPPPAAQFVDHAMQTEFGFSNSGPGPLSHTDAEYEAWFTILDQNRTGYIEGENARSFLRQSGLNDDELFTIWEQSDADLDGRLSLPEFLTACHLVADRVNSPSPAVETELSPPTPEESQPQISFAPTATDPFLSATGATDPWAADMPGDDPSSGQEGKQGETGGTTDAPVGSGKSRKKKAHAPRAEAEEGSRENLEESGIPSFGDLVKNESKKSSKSASSRHVVDCLLCLPPSIPCVELILTKTIANFYSSRIEWIRTVGKRLKMRF